MRKRYKIWHYLDLNINFYQPLSTFINLMKQPLIIFRKIVNPDIAREWFLYDAFHAR